ncbi:hypothetical protein AVEN_178331-1 [Araneus ventricosus]|uniref:Integrase p58-like C-terminal domain-containing protein n=1 Tax=Araneus ventricosus TaxID=182803 RepID=A0A4Y2BEE4_ARAVE|nr:hypothetical protein AVEN_178331-1 [Araneus ventricosus]
MFTREQVWIQRPLDDAPVCLPLAEIKLKGEFGHLITKTAVVCNKADKGRYLFGNRTATILEKMKKIPFPQQVNAIQTRPQKRLRDQEEFHLPSSRQPVQRFQRTFRRIRRVLCSEDGPDWEKYVHADLFALRTVAHESTGFRPTELVHERNLRTPVTLLYNNWLQPEKENTQVAEYVSTLLNILKLFQDLAVKEMETSQQRNKAWYDKRVLKREFQEGDLVLIFFNCRAKKLSPRLTGPGTILKKLSEINYVVSVPQRKDKYQLYHVNMLNPCYKRPEKIN